MLDLWIVFRYLIFWAVLGSGVWFRVRVRDMGKVVVRAKARGLVCSVLGLLLGLELEFWFLRVRVRHRVIVQLLGLGGLMTTVGVGHGLGLVLVLVL
jgi:hypothetical protein